MPSKNNRLKRPILVFGIDPSRLGDFRKKARRAAKSLLRKRGETMTAKNKRVSYAHLRYLQKEAMGSR